MRNVINPDSVFDPSAFAYSQGAVTDGSRMLHIAGQAALDAQLQILGNDIATQARITLANLSAILKDQGLSPANLASIRIYIVDLTEEKLGLVVAELAQFYGDAAPAPNTVLGVSALALDGLLVEIDGVAVFD